MRANICPQMTEEQAKERLSFLNKESKRLSAAAAVFETSLKAIYFEMEKIHKERLAIQANMIVKITKIVSVRNHNKTEQSFKEYLEGLSKEEMEKLMEEFQVNLESA